MLFAAHSMDLHFSVHSYKKQSTSNFSLLDHRFLQFDGCGDIRVQRADLQALQIYDSLAGYLSRHVICLRSLFQFFQVI